MKIKQIKIDYVVGGKLQKEISIANNFVTRAYENYTGKTIEDKQLLTSIIKVMLSTENGLGELTNGITYNNKKYFPLITSPSMQKKEEDFEGEDYRLEYLFIEENDKDFKKILERLLSGNKIAEFKVEKKKMCLVKDISARLGLATTGTYRINYKPNIVIVDEAFYNYTGKYSFYKDGKIVNDILEREYILNDGGGLMSNKCASEIAYNLGLDYRVDFAIVRAYKGLAIKGVTLRFDFAKYFKENYEADFGISKKDKFGFRLINGSYEIKDIFGKWHNVDTIDLLLNKSQTKWSKNWSSIEELDKEYQDEFYNDYRGILDCFYVSKVNKNPNKLKKFTKINYQVIQNTCLTGEDLIEIATPDINYYKRLLNFDDVDAIRLFLGDLVHEDKEGEFATISDKLNFMLKKQGESALKLKWVKRQIARMITKKIKELSGGKINMLGGYKICALDPISYCNFLLNGNTGINGLDKNEFYITGQKGNRVMYRNPIAMYQEVQKINVVDKLDKWLKDYTSEIIFFNGKDDTLFKLSTADVDGDGVGVINNSTLYDCVVDEEYPFINIEDGQDGEPHIFTDEKLYEDIIISSGNIIGRIALNNSKLNMICRSVDNFVIDNRQFYTYRMLQKKYCSDKKIDFNSLKDDKEEYKKCKEAVNNKISELQKEKALDKVGDYNNKSIRKIISSLFKEHKEDYSNILLASQLSIDMPKTLRPVPDEILEKFAWLQGVGKPVFMHYLGKCSCKGKGNVNNCKDLIHWKKWSDFEQLKNNSNIKKKNNMMDIFNMHIVKELYIDDKKTAKGRESIKEILNILDYKCKELESSETLEKIIRLYKKGRNEYKHNSEKLDLLDLKVFRKLQEINLSDDEIVATIKNNESKFDVRFILMFLFDTYKRKVEEQQLCDLYSFKKDKKGNIGWMYEKYLKVGIDNFKEKDIKKESYKNILNKTDNLITVRFGGLTTEEIEGKSILIKIGEFTDSKGNTKQQAKVIIDDEMIGYIFNDKLNLINLEKQYKIFSIKADSKKKTATVELEVI